MNKLIQMPLIAAMLLLAGNVVVGANPFPAPMQTDDLGDNLTLTVSGAGADGSSKASGSSYNNVRDGDTTTFWSPSTISNEYVAVKWSNPVTSTTIILREPSASVTDWRLETKEGQILASGDSIGRELLVTYSAVSTAKIYLYLNSATAIPQITEFEVYNDDSTATGGPFTLTTSISPSNGGSVDLDPAGGTYPDSTVVTLTAQSNPGFTFAGWSGDVSGGDSTISILMNDNNTVIAVFTPAGGSGNQDTFSIIGYAMVNGSTTGGFGGNTVLVSTGTELQDAIKNKDSQPLTIYVTGTINLANSPGLSKIDIKDVDDISILGFGNGAEFDGIGIKVTRASNIIIRNLNIHHVLSGDKDAISIEGPADHIWVDHCELHAELDNVDQDYYDGLFDIKRDVDYITFSWNYLHDSWKCSLSGSSESDTYDRHVTYHHNRYEHINSRTPLFRSGKGHVFNNYYHDIVSTAINTRINACVRIEHNFFESVNNPWVSAYSDVLGAAEIIGNHLVGSSFDYSRSDVSEPLDCTLPLPYDYSTALDSAVDVKTIVMAGAGVGKVFLTNFPTSLTDPLNESAMGLRLFPNPGDGHVTVSVDLRAESNIRLRLLNAMGQEIKRWPAQRLNAGPNEIFLDASDVPAGVYWVECVAAPSGKAQLVTRQVLVKR